MENSFWIVLIVLGFCAGMVTSFYLFPQEIEVLQDPIVVTEYVEVEVPVNKYVCKNNDGASVEREFDERVATIQRDSYENVTGYSKLQPQRKNMTRTWASNR